MVKSGLASVDLTASNVAYLRAALCRVDDSSPDWKRVLNEFGLGKGNYG
jgi:hypothetical protein